MSPPCLEHHAQFLDRQPTLRDLPLSPYPGRLVKLGTALRAAEALKASAVTPTVKRLIAPAAAYTLIWRALGLRWVVRHGSGPTSRCHAR